MSTASPAAPALAPGHQTSEFSLAKLAAFGGLGLILLAVALGIFHPVADLQHQLMLFGFSLLAGSPTVYGGFRTVLKYAAMGKKFLPEADAVAALIPGTAGVEAKSLLALAHKLADALPDPDTASAPTPSPAPAVVAAAAAAPVAPTGGA